MPKRIKKAGGKLLDALLPPRCLGCHAPVAEQGNFCAACWGNLHFLSHPACARCFHPFDYALGEGALCGACMAELPPYDEARAVFAYNEASRPLVTRFKYADGTHAARTFARLLAAAGRDMITASDMIIPVPLHRRRLFARRYNQAALLANALAEESGVPCHPALLRRIRHIPPQAGLDRAGRKRNVKGAFALTPRGVEMVAGKTVLLVDDVLTTGATLHECTKMLKKAGAAKVFVLTLAKTVKE